MAAEVSPQAECHRQRERSAVAYLALAWLAVTVAVAGGALGGSLAWRGAPPLPTNEQVRTLLAPALPSGVDLPAAQRWDFTFADNPRYTDPGWVYQVGGTDEYENGRVFFDIAMPDPQCVRLCPDSPVVSQTVRDAESRMRAAGWRTLYSDGGDCCPSVALRRDGWVAVIGSNGFLDDGHWEYELAIARDTPSAVAPSVVGGVVAGGVVGGLLGWWTVRRVGRQSRLRGRVALVGLGAGLLALLPATGLSALSIATLSPGGDSFESAPWWGYTFLLARPLSVLGAVAILAALLFAAWPSGERRGTAYSSWRAGSGTPTPA